MREEEKKRIKKGIREGERNRRKMKQGKEKERRKKVKDPGFSSCLLELPFASSSCECGLEPWSETRTGLLLGAMTRLWVVTGGK